MWAILNFEASGLSDQSYPIEVGYALPDAEGYSLLINPLHQQRNGVIGMILLNNNSTIVQDKS